MSQAAWVLTTHLYRVSRLRITVDIILIPMYAFVVWTGAVLALMVQIRKIKRRYNRRQIINRLFNKVDNHP